MISLARDLNISAAASEAKPSSNIRRATRGAVIGLWDKIKYILSFLSFVWCRYVWPFTKKNIFVPTAIFFVALYAASLKFLTARKHEILCISHQLAAAIARARAQRLSCVAVLAFVSVLLFTTAFYSFGIEVIIDGESLGYVISQADYQESVMHVQTRVSKIMGTPLSVNPNVAFSFGIVERDNILEGEKLESLLYSQIEGVEELYTLTVDGVLVGACRDRESVEAALSSLTAAERENSSKKILSDYKISFAAVETVSLCTTDELIDRLHDTNRIETTHTVAKKQTASSICRAYGMTRSELRKLNPDVDTSSLSEGQEVIVMKTVPVLSVQEFTRLTETVEIPYETKKVNDSSIYKGKTSVKTNGVAGKKQVVSDVTYVDGKETDRILVSETVISEPVTKVVLVGTKPVPKKAATGTFRRPTGKAVVSSNYGYRRSGFHTGVDFALAHGSPVYASDGGTVSFSGWKGGYGYLVIINHGNGMQTYYAHNSKLLVKRGQKVGKGEQIAKIGSTGNSSGPHCHFEIRVNGRHVNPWRYID